MPGSIFSISGQMGATVRFFACTFFAGLALQAWSNVLTDVRALDEAEIRGLIDSLHVPADEEVPFSQRQLNPLFRKVASQSGVLTKSAEGGLVMQVLEPRAERRTLQDGWVSVTRKSRNPSKNRARNVERRTQLDPERPSHLVLLALEALVRGDHELLYAHFALSAEVEGDVWRLLLIPLHPTVKKQLTRVLAHGQGNVLTLLRSERDSEQGGISHFLEVEVRPLVVPTADSA
jgi:hypothetical protein